MCKQIIYTSITVPVNILSQGNWKYIMFQSTLTHLCQVDSSTLTLLIRPFPIYRLSG